MADKKTWTKKEILEIWPQAAGELRGFQRHLERNASITASQLGMALQLAEEEYKRLLPKVCERCKEETDTVEVVDEIVDRFEMERVKACPKCAKKLKKKIQHLLIREYNREKNKR